MPTMVKSQQRLCIVDQESNYVPKPLSTNLLSAHQDSVLTINVVVHVVYNSIFNDISEQAINEQMEVLNEDYNQLNADTTDVPDMFKSVAGNPQIRFQLATRDTLGQATTGITRTRTTVGNFWIFDRLQQTALGGKDPWDQSRYLNIWVAQISSRLPGYSNTPDFIGTLQDGVSIDYRAFGTSGRVRDPFVLGRTTTHEVGHYLGLRHIWGPTGQGCVEDDGIADTPNQMNSTPGCFTDQSTCNTPDMRTNFMDYTNDVCMNLFTQGQADRMRNTLLTLRSSLLQPLPVSNDSEIPNKVKANFEIFPNPSSGRFRMVFDESAKFPVDIRVVDMLGKEVFKQSISTPESFDIDLRFVPAGQYQLISISADQSLASKSIHIH